MKKSVWIVVLCLLVTGLAISSPITLRIWAMGEEAKSLHIMAERFTQENPDIRVDIQAIPWAGAYDKLLTGIAAGQLPDIAQMGTTWMAPFGAMGAFEELSRYIDRSNVIKPERFFEGSWQTSVTSAGVMGIPWYVDVRVMYYRTDLLAAVGYEQAPQTWEELYDAGLKLTARGPQQAGLSLLFTGTFANEFMPFAWQNAGRILDEAGNVTVAEQAFVEAIEFYARLFWDEIALKAGGELINDFGSGAVPIFFSGPWMVRMIEQQIPQIAGKWSVGLLPGNKSHTSFVGGSNWVIFRASRNKEAAWKFVEFMSRSENQLEWYRIVSSLPAVMETWDEPELAEEPIMSIFGAQLLDARAAPNIPQWGQIEQAISRRVEEAIFQTKTPEAAAQDLLNDIQRVLRRQR